MKQNTMPSYLPVVTTKTLELLVAKQLHSSYSWARSKGQPILPRLRIDQIVTPFEFMSATPPEAQILFKIDSVEADFVAKIRTRSHAKRN